MQENLIIETYPVKNKYVKTHNGKVRILEVHKTKKLQRILVHFDNGKILKAAPHHKLINTDFEEISSINSLNQNIISDSKRGYSKVIKIEKTDIYEHMYDISIDSKDQLYFSSGVLSHNSGKTITIGTYLLWRANFHKDRINIGVLANRPRTAREVLNKIKQIFLNLPIWLAQSVETWNKSDIELGDTRTRILTDSPSENSFRGDTIALLYVDELGFINKKDWDAVVDSIIPTMNSLSFKQLIYSSTANGVNHWSEIVLKAREGSNDILLVENDWREVPHYDKKGNLIPPDKYKEMMIKRYSLKYFLSTEENEFLGSNTTLVSSESLKRIQDNVKNRKIIKSYNFRGLNIYKEPEKNHSYIISVDSSKDGIDDFSINIIDITKFPFEQVSDANLQVDYLTMPEYLDELGKIYNDALIIVENNSGDGQSITDTLWSVYEYKNLYRDKNIEGRIGFKRYTGFRTTIKSRNIILGLLKTFIEENKLIINSETTLKQLYTFTKNDSGKYIAEDGYKDDNIMSLAIAFAPFMESKVFDDYELFVKELKSDSNIKTKEFISTLDLAFTSDAQESEQERVKKFFQETNSLNVFDDYGVSEEFNYSS